EGLNGRLFGMGSLMIECLGRAPSSKGPFGGLWRTFRITRDLFAVTTHRAFNEWPELFDNAVLASAALDRLAHGATQLVISGDSYRSKGPRSRTALVKAGR